MRAKSLKSFNPGPSVPSPSRSTGAERERPKRAQVGLRPVHRQLAKTLRLLRFFSAANLGRELLAMARMAGQRQPPKHPNYGWLTRWSFFTVPASITLRDSHSLVTTNDSPPVDRRTGRTTGAFKGMPRPRSACAGTYPWRFCASCRCRPLAPEPSIRAGPASEPSGWIMGEEGNRGGARGGFVRMGLLAPLCVEARASAENR
jgi:hypothetical protein